MNLCELEISARLIFFDEEEHFDYLLSGISGGSYDYIKSALTLYRWKKKFIFFLGPKW